MDGITGPCHRDPCAGKHICAGQVLEQWDGIVPLECSLDPLVCFAWRDDTSLRERGDVIPMGLGKYASSQVEGKRWSMCYQPGGRHTSAPGQANRRCPRRRRCTHEESPPV